MPYTPDPALLLANLASPFTAEALFDCMSDTVFFIKDGRGRYLVVNQTLVERSGLDSKADLIGCTPSEILGERLGAGYEAQDQAVLASGETITNKLELHVHANQRVGWCLTNKMPLADADGAVIGLAGISQDLRLPNLPSDDYAHIAAAISYAEKYIATAPTVRQLCTVAEMSPYRLDRRFRRIFGLSTGQWMLKMRIDHARHELVSTELPIATVALNAGYADQSAFTRQFRLTTGMSPSAFRRAN